MQETITVQEQFNLSIVFVRIEEKKSKFQSIRKKINPNIDFDKNHLTQGTPFSWGIKVKNIDTKPTPECIIKNYGLKNTEETYHIAPSPLTAPEKRLRTLNPEEETTIMLDHAIPYLEGILWAHLKIESAKQGQIINAYQHNPHHNIDSICHPIKDGSNWYDIVYVQDKMELLQNRTNNYILALTIISVWESLFGIKSTLSRLFSISASTFESIGNGLKYLASLLT